MEKNNRYRINRKGLTAIGALLLGFIFLVGVLNRVLLLRLNHRIVAALSNPEPNFLGNVDIAIHALDSPSAVYNALWHASFDKNLSSDINRRARDALFFVARGTWSFERSGLYSNSDWVKIFDRFIEKKIERNSKRLSSEELEFLHLLQDRVKLRNNR